MSLERQLDAWCDHPGCYQNQTLNPDTTQPYRDLSEVGWALGDDGESIYCPDHKRSAHEPDD